MAKTVETLDLANLDLSSGAGRSLEIAVELSEFDCLGEPCRPRPKEVDTRLDVSRTTSGWALRLRFVVEVVAPCSRCLKESTRELEIDAREVDQPGAGEDLRCPYLDDSVLSVAEWAQDSMVLELPTRLLCRSDCRGLCPQCGIDLNELDEGVEHGHSQGRDPRWAKLDQLR